MILSPTSREAAFAGRPHRSAVTAVSTELARVSEHADLAMVRFMICLSPSLKADLRATKISVISGFPPHLLYRKRCIPAWRRQAIRRVKRDAASLAGYCCWVLRKVSDISPLVRMLLGANHWTASKAATISPTPLSLMSRLNDLRDGLPKVLARLLTVYEGPIQFGLFAGNNLQGREYGTFELHQLRYGI
jgi:hypothetical protein